MHHLDGIYLFKVESGNTRTMWEISSKLTTKTPEQRPELPVKTPQRR